MGIKLDFDSHGNPQTPTFVLATRNGTKIGKIENITDVHLKVGMKDPEGSLTVHKYDGDEVIPYWDDIKDFKLMWCKESDVWFEIKINTVLSDEVTKQVTLQRLGEAELSQIKIYGMEVNTEDDILRDDYVQPTVFYNEDKPTASFVHRMLEKAPHYRIRHIDEHLKGIQKIFSFNDKDVKACFDEAEESMDILFDYESGSKEDGTPDRTIDIYDLKSYCKNCGARGKFVDKCLNCGSENITEGYGVDTTIFISRENLGNEINIAVNTDEVKNCYRLEGGDELMTATIRNCNPNGTSYIWDFAEVTKRDMDAGLVEKIEQYKEDYDYYKDSYVSDLSSAPVSAYNTLVNKYNSTSEDLKLSKITSVVGYAPIMEHYYDAIDLALYIESGLLPNTSLQDTTVEKEAAKLTASALSPVAVVDKKYITLANASTAVLNAAKIGSDPRYQIKVNQASLSGTTWTGNFTVTNYNDERDTCVSATINVTVNDDYETYINQKLKKTLYNSTRGKYGSITQMIDMDTATFQAELNKYNLTALKSFNTCFTECVKLLSEQGIDREDADLYDSVYLPVYNKIGYIQAEVAERESELAVVNNMQSKLLGLKQYINEKLDLETYLGADYWLDFCAYRREETYSNGNYISDYLSNKELFSRAEEFITMAEYEISKASNHKHEISSTLKNILSLDEFKPLVSYFETGNWIRVIDDDGEVYKLRLIDYEVNFEDLNTLTVTFSDVVRTIDGLEPVKEILVKSSDIINNYNAAMNKTNSSFESINDAMNGTIYDSNFNNDYIYDSSNDLNGELKTLIEVKDGLVRTYIEDVDNKLSSEITQTATQIKSEVNDVENGLNSTITQTAAQIRSEVTDIENGLSSTITQTASEIRSEVSDIESGLDSRITQNADSISVEITDRKSADSILSSEISATAKEIKAEITSANNDLYGKISLEIKGIDDKKLNTSDLKTQINLVADDIVLTGKTTFDNGKKIQDLISSAQSTADTALTAASSADSNASSAYNHADSVSNALDTYKTACAEGTTTINGGCIKTGYIDSSCIKTDYFTTQAANGSAGWTILKHSTADDAAYVCGNNSESNNVVLKTGGNVAFACGMDVGYMPGYNTSTYGAKVQIWHNGNINCLTINDYTPITAGNISSYLTNNVTLSSSDVTVSYTSAGNIYISGANGYISESGYMYGNIASVGWVKGKCATLQDQIDNLKARIETLEG